MDDDRQMRELESRLRRYRVVGPPAELRHAVLRRRSPRLAWGWATAAALLLAAIVFNIAARRLDARTTVLFREEPEAAAQVELLTDVFGDPETARQLAPVLAMEQRLLQEVEERRQQGFAP